MFFVRLFGWDNRRYLMVSDLGDLKDMLFRLNLEMAIPGEVRHSLAEILPLLKKERLMDLAYFYSVSGRSRMNKPELVDCLLERMQEFGQFVMIAVMLRDVEKDFLQSLIAKNTRGRKPKEKPEPRTGVIIKDNYAPPLATGFLMDIGLVFSFIKDGQISFICTDEVLEAYPVLFSPTSEGMRIKYQYVHSYLVAMTNLYGVFPVQHFCDIFLSQNPGFGTTESDLLTVVYVLCKREQEYETDGSQIVNTIYNSELADPNGLGNLQRQVQGKPFYVPAKDELFKYEDDLYYPPTDELDALQSFLLQEICPDKMAAEELADEIKLLCMSEASSNEIMKELERHNLVFKSEQQVKNLALLIVDVSNTSRMVSNRGFTPLELRRQRETYQPQTSAKASHPKTSHPETLRSKSSRAKITMLFPPAGL